MRLGINALIFESFTNTSGNIVPFFIKQLSADNKDWPILIFLREESKIEGDYPLNAEFIHVKIPNLPLAHFFYQQLILPFIFWHYNLDKILTIGQTFIYALNKKNVFMLYDFDFLKFPTEYSFRTKLIFRANLYIARMFNIRCVVPTNYIREEAINLFKFNPKNVDVVPLGVPLIRNPEINYQALLQDLKMKFGINKNYFYYIGSDASHKNITRTIEAFSLFNVKKNGGYALILSGKSFSVNSKTSQYIRANKLKNIICTGEIKDDEKIALYSGSVALLFLSFYEGFGLPIIEAQSLGVPVVAANIGASKEVLKESALLVDPLNVSRIAATLLWFVNNKKIGLDLTKNGYENIKRFGWEKSAASLKNSLIN